jgi:hypothetical protein
VSVEIHDLLLSRIVEIDALAEQGGPGVPAFRS